MYCGKCGKECNDEDVFCRFCGSPVNSKESDNSAGIENCTRENESFNFSGLTRNKTSTKTINKWLAESRKVIHSIALHATANYFIPLRWETSISRVEFEYEDNDDGYIYQIDYFCSYAWIGGSFAKVDYLFEKWKYLNPDKTVVWSTHAGHKADGGSTYALYFLYR